MHKLSIFVDESGDFGEYQPHSPYYIVTMVIHEQDVNIYPQIDRLNNSLALMNLPNHTIHTEPLIRREENYIHMSPNEPRHRAVGVSFVLIRYRSRVHTSFAAQSAVVCTLRTNQMFHSFIEDNGILPKPAVFSL